MGLDNASWDESRKLRRAESKVYLSARFDRQEELKKYADVLKRNGLEITARWLWMPAAYLADDWQFKDICAHMDFEDVKRCDVVVSFTGDPKHQSKGGRHIEFGIGLAFNKRMIIIGECENIFHFMYDVEVYPDFDTFVQTILGDG